MEVRPILAQLSRNKTGALLIALQVALTLAIVSNAVDLIRSRLDSANRPSGVADEQRVLTERLILNADTDLESLLKRDLDALRGIPGVEAVTLSNQMPLGRSGWNSSMAARREPGTPIFPTGLYFDDGRLAPTLGLKLLEGRWLSSDEVLVSSPDRENTEPAVTVISEALARALFPDADSWVGRTIFQGTGLEATELRVVGVMERLITPWAQNSADATYSLLLPQVFLNPYNYYVVRAEAGQEEAVRKAMDERLMAVENQRVSLGVKSIAELRDQRFRAERAVAWLLLAVTALLLLVTASGIVGMASLWVNLRRKQIGVRRALGATRGDIVAYFVTENLLISTFGIALGALGAYALNHFLMSQFDMPALSALQVPLGAAALLLLGQMAVIGPALRGAGIPPSVATRSV